MNRAAELKLPEGATWSVLVNSVASLCGCVEGLVSPRR